MMEVMFDQVVTFCFILTGVVREEEEEEVSSHLVSVVK